MCTYGKHLSQNLVGVRLYSYTSPLRHKECSEEYETTDTVVVIPTPQAVVKVAGRRQFAQVQQTAVGASRLTPIQKYK
ncbi:hypothetical protein GYMLUDRAFT_65868 [Collybiopsis luxurians FD-317 M1]|nr:hypothetical protein GYMLUDRAFT_65868 [Collybiopsis luxurians FD-317 M1]